MEKPKQNKNLKQDDFKKINNRTKMLISSKYYIHFRQTNKMQSQYNQLISTNTSDQTTLIRDASPKSKSYKKY